ncbi:putative iron reductase domain protein [Hypoxylon trugodes]|uniref:putative iron reductase domain protein n=1 Tax=Hypoxylon trugodes TaxID=326681 RepID=UPI002194C0F4|nr:putative iron reductase domain protein [Hypoxylon trugodes]KAI1389421.1 putative iron reductase domain protein [Hypoxylon trugodes]
MKAFSVLSRLGLASIFSSFVVSSQVQDASSTSSDTTAGSVFITPAKDLAFALNVPDNSTTDIYFSFMMPTGISWGAIGLGSNHMAGALILLVYPSASGNNVTLSPRLGSGHTEPVYTPDIKIEALSGTGLNNDTYTFNGRCSSCRSWLDGSGKIDVKSTTQNMLYATGEDDNNLKSDSFEAPLKMHYNYGTFTMDMVHATGPAGVPIIDTAEDSKLVATVQGLSKEGKKDVKAMMHAIIMVLTFVGLYPFGVFVLRLGSWVRWHGINQAFAFVLTIIGSSLGFSISGTYNRSKKFNTAHQVIGILIFIFIFAQFAIGFLNHRKFKQTQQKTKMAPIHVWMGRVIIIMGVINGFLGFPLAQSSQFNYVLAGLVLFIFPGMLLILVVKRFLQKRWEKRKNQPNGYDLEPWLQTNNQAGNGSAQEIPGQNASIPGMASYAPYQANGMKTVDLGPPQNTREYV